MSDTISRQAAAEVIYRALKTPVPDYRKDPFHDTMGLAYAMATEIPSAQPEQRWIPCSERLPKKGTRAVLLYSNEKISGGVYMGDRTWNVDYNDTDLSVYIVAWQPTKQI